MGSVIKIRGIPFDRNALDICDFFDGKITEEQIHFVSDRVGGTKPHSGDAFIDCAGVAQSRELLKYDRRNLGTRYIEVMNSSEMDKQAAGKRLISYNNVNSVEESEDVNTDLVLKARGLPFDATAGDVAAIFEEFGIDESNVVIDMHLTGKRRGQPSGYAFVIFASAADRDLAFEEKQKCTMGSRYLELFQANHLDMKNLVALSQHDEKISAGTGKSQGGNMGMGIPGGMGVSGGMGGMGMGGGAGGGSAVQLRGLPWTATKEDVQDFFEPNFVVEARDIEMTTDAKGRPSGGAVVTLGSAIEADEAKEQLNRKHMGDRYIEVFEAGPDKGGRRVVPSVREREPRRMRSPPKVGAGKGFFGWIRLRGLPFSASQADVVEFMRFSFGVSAKDVLLESRGGRASGQAYVKLKNRDDVPDAVAELHKTCMGPRYIEVYASSGDEVAAAMQRD